MLIQCLSFAGGILLTCIGLYALYGAFFDRKALVAGYARASPAVTTAIATVMGIVITYIGLFLLYGLFFE